MACSQMLRQAKTLHLPKIMVRTDEYTQIGLNDDAKYYSMVESVDYGSPV